MRIWLTRSLACAVGACAAAVLAVPPPATNSLTATRAALEDGLYDLAGQQARRIMDAADVNATDAAEAAIIAARALHAQERFGEVLALLDDTRQRAAPPVSTAAFRFWRAMALFGLQQYAEALTELDAIDAAGGGGAYAPRVLRLRAWCLNRIGRRDEALSLFARFDRENPDSLEAFANLLEWSRILIEAGDNTAARQQLENLISRGGSHGTAQEARLLLARVLVQERRYDRATTVLENLAGDTAARIDRRADAWFALAEMYRDRTNYDESLNAVMRGLELAPTPELKRLGAISRGRLMLKLNRLDEGALQLKRVITAEPDRAQSGVLQLELARAWYDAAKNEHAAQEYQYYLETFTNREGRAEAASGLGMALFRAGRHAEAATAFEKAMMLIDAPAGKAQTLYKIGDARFAYGQYLAAADAYQQLIADYPDSELVPGALCQLGESLFRSGQHKEAARYFERVVERFPRHAMAERAILRLAECREEMGNFAEALKGYQSLMDNYTNSPLYVNALQRRGMLLYHLFRFEEALQAFTRVVNEFKFSALAEQAFFWRVRPLYMLGRDDEALDVCRSFVTQYTNSEYVPGVQFWIGEYQYNRGRYAEAEVEFKRVFDLYPQDPLADDALYWTGRSAQDRKEYIKAIEIFGRLARQYPSSPMLAEARFHQGEAMREIGDVAGAILVFQEIITRYPTNALVRMAWIRKGDCQFTLGAEDTRRYEEALNSYRIALAGEQVPADLRLQAEYKIGRCYEKSDRAAEALEQYYTRVVCRYFEERARSRQANPSLDMWFTRAAFAAADLLETQGNWRRAVKVLQRVVEAGVPAARDAQERINRIKTDHWSLFY